MNSSLGKTVLFLTGADQTVGRGPIARRIARRGTELGWIAEGVREPKLAPAAMRRRWKAAKPVALPGFLRPDLHRVRAHVGQSERLVEKILEGAELMELLTRDPYRRRLFGEFELVSSIVDESDDQEIEKLELAAVTDRGSLAEDLWVKVAWLSFYEEDPSLRFRFSFGMENYEDVAADLERERLAARLCDAVFPESSVITENAPLRSQLCDILGVGDLEYLERIVYFNGPQGGAQFHHDVERGHLGVVFAQLTGETAWLALSTGSLLGELRAFLSSPDVEGALAAFAGTEILESLNRYRAQPELLRTDLHDPSNDFLEMLLNRVPAFFGQLVSHGHAQMLGPGDVLLLPQQSLEHCAWHSVYCLGDEVGEGLSFAIRAVG